MIDIRLRAALFLAATLLGAGAAHAQSQQTLGELNQLMDEDIAYTRKSCALGEAPAWVSAQRARYGTKQHFPDASDMCVATLTAIAGDGHMASLYRELLVAWGGDLTDYAQWPRSIGAVAMANETEVSIGNRKVIDLTPSLAFDAGFTVAYGDGSAARAPSADVAQLKALAAACLEQRGKPGPCFAAGYVYGAHAYEARTSSAD